MAITASHLREHVDRILDDIIETGQPRAIEHGGRRLRIVLIPSRVNRLDRLEAHPDAVTGDPEDLVHLDWSPSWAAD